MDQEKNVISAVEAMTSAFHQGDIDSVMASYEQSATIVFAPEEPVTDRRTQREKFLEFFALSPRFSYSGHEVFVTGDTAVHLAPWTMVGTMPDGQEVTDQGLSVAVLSRQDDGRWLIVIDNPYGQYLLNRELPGSSAAP